MSKEYILSIDQGTTSTTVSLIDRHGHCLGKINKEVIQYYPRSGWVEHDPENIWQSVVSGIQGVLQIANIKGSQIAAIGITNQRETALIWDRQTHKPIHRAIVWQCRRTTDFCDQLKKRTKEKVIRQKTGLVIDPYFSASKWRWLCREVPHLKNKLSKGLLAGGTVDTFLLWRLTGGLSHCTDVSNASRTQLMNIHQAKWDPELLKIFSIHSHLLPEIRPSAGEFGKTKNCPGLPDGIPISGIAGDQQAALFGQICFLPGESKCTYGTGSFLLMNTGKKAVKSRSGLLTTVAWQLSEKDPLTYALEGGAFICGAAVQWLRDGLKIIKSSEDIERIANKVDSTEGLEFVPSLSGLGAPYWDPHARGMISGITRGTTDSHLARATLEAMALQNVDTLKAMEKDLKKKLKDVRVDGGASANNLLMQIQADYLGLKILRPQFIETTVMGAAFLAGLGIKFWSDLQEIKRVWKVEKEFTPRFNSSTRKKRLESWRKAISRVRVSY